MPRVRVYTEIHSGGGFVLKQSFVFAVFLAAALPVAGQSVFRPPQMPGAFQPVVGSGATYQIKTANNPDVQFSYAVVGKEGDAYWMEIRSATPRGSMVMKQLMSMPGAGQTPQIQRMIMQAAGQPPMEMPVSMLQGAAGRSSMQGGSGPRALGEKVGTETVTVPAGTFECEHYRSASNGKTADVWVSAKVSPYGLVKMISGETRMELQKVLAHETSQITGEPTKLPGFPGRT
jgi:hypothetical protein